MANNIGLEIVEGIASGLAPFRDPSKRNIGLLMERERGVPNVIRDIKSLEDDKKYFGAVNATSFGGYFVKSMFDNAKDSPIKYLGVRLVGVGSLAATSTGTLQSIAVTTSAAFRGQSDPGSWGNNLKIRLYTYDSKARNNFLIEIFFKGQLVESFAEVSCALLQLSVNRRSSFVSINIASEISKQTLAAVTGTVTTSITSQVVTGVGTTFTTLSLNNLLFGSDGTLIGRVKSIESATSLTLSGYAAVALTAAAINSRVDAMAELIFTGGIYVAPAEADFYPVSDAVAPKGLAIFDGSDVQILAVTENHSLSMAVKGRDYCGNRSDCIFVANLPLNSNEGVIENFANTLQTPVRNFIACYLDWVNIYNVDGDIIIIPGIAAILGAAYVRTPFLQGDYIHIPPGGIESALVNIVSVATGNLSQAQVNRYVKDYSVNVTRTNENYGTYVLSSRTMSTNPLFQSVHICMQTNFYIKLLDRNMVFILQKPNTPELKKEALIKITSYFEKEYERGALERSISFDQAFKTVCDQSNNPLGQDRKTLNIDINYIPTECIESVRISLNRNDALLTTKVTNNA